MKPRRPIQVYVICAIIIIGTLMLTLSFVACSLVDLVKTADEEECVSVYQQIAYMNSAILFAMFAIICMIAGYLLVRIVKGIDVFYHQWLEK